MATTTVSFTADQDQILANLNWLPLAAGDTLSFANTLPDGAPALFFSPDLSAILTPTPPPSLVLSPGTSPVFTVASAQPGAYTILVGFAADIQPFFPERSSTKLFFESLPSLAGVSIEVDPPVKPGN